MSEIAIKITADEAAFIQALARATAAEEKHASGAAKISAEYRKLTAEQKAMVRDAEKAFADTRTPQEAYAARIDRIGQMLSAGKIDQETYNRAVAQAKVRLDEASGATAKAREEQAALAQAAKQAEEKQQAMARAAEHVEQATRTPLERYNAQLAKLKQLLDAGKISQDTYTRAVGQAKSELDATAKKTEDTFGPKVVGWVQGLAGALGITGGLAGVVGVLRGEYEAMTAAQERAARSTMTVAGAQREALLNLGAKADEEREAFTMEIRQISQETGVSERDLYQRASTALSARGSLSTRDAMDAVRVSALMSPDAAVGEKMAGAALDLDKILTAQGRPVGAEETLGYLQAIGATARVVDPAKLGANLAPSMTAAMATGASEAEAGALWSALTQSMADPTGEQSKTASIAFAVKLRDFFSEQEVDPTATLEKQAEAQAANERAARAKTFAERLALLQSDEAMRSEFLDVSKFEIAAKIPIEQLVSGQGTSSAAYTQALSSLPKMEDADEFFRSQMNVIDADPTQIAARGMRSLSSGLEGLSTLDPMAAMSGAARENMTAILQQTGMGGLESKIFGGLREAGGADTTIAQLETRAANLRNPMEVIGAGGYGAGAMGVREATPLELQQAQALEAIATTLRDVQQQLAQSTGAPVVEKLGEVVDELKGQRADRQRPTTPQRLGNPDQKAR